MNAETQPTKRKGRRPDDLCRVCDRYAIGCEPMRFPDGSRLRMPQRNKAERFCPHHHPRINAQRVATREANRETCRSWPLKEVGNYTVGGRRRTAQGTYARTAVCRTSLKCQGKRWFENVNRVKVIKLRAPAAITDVIITSINIRCSSLRDFRKSGEDDYLIIGVTP